MRQNRQAWRPRIAALSAILALASPARAQSNDLPPSWLGGPRTDQTGSQRSERPYKPKSTRGRPWYLPRAALGVGLNVPEILPLEGYLFFGRYVALRAFYTTPMPTNVRVEMPSDVITVHKGALGVANPDFTIRLKATYGAHYGLEALAFPFGGSFFVALGTSYRRMRLVGAAKSPILVCSLIEAAKEPPCGDPNASIQTRTQLALNADVETEALLTRGGIGWFWHVGSAAYFMTNLGITRPSRIDRKAKVEATLDTPSTVDEEITGALAEVKTERERDLESKAKKEMRPVDEKTLPILGLAFGIRF